MAEKKCLHVEYNTVVLFYIDFVVIMIYLKATNPVVDRNSLL